MTEGKPFALGLLGTGAIAQVVHLPTIATMRGARIAAVCDRDHDKAAALANRFGIDVVVRAEEALFQNPDIDGVLVCTPSHLHEAQAIAALRAGKHVLVEKPLALTSEGARRVLAVAEETGRSLMVAMNNRYRQDTLALKPFAHGGELGDVFFAKAGWLNRKVRVNRPTWRHRRETAGGGALMDLGVQVIDLALWTLGFPHVERVVAHMHPAEGMDVEDSAGVLCTLKDGPILSVEVTWSMLDRRDRHYLQLLGTRGSATLAPLSVYKEVEQGLLDVSPNIGTGEGNAYTASYRQLIRHFIDTAQGTRPLELPHEQVGVMRLIEMAYQSAAEGREVHA